MCAAVRVASGTWREEAVEVSDDGSERGSQRRLVLHAAGDHAGQFSPLRSWELVLVFVEQQLLHDTQEHQLESAARSAGRSAEGPAHLGPVVRRERVFSAAVDLPQRGAEAPLICCQTQALAVLHALGRNPRDPVHQNYRQNTRPHTPVSSINLSCSKPQEHRSAHVLWAGR